MATISKILSSAQFCGYSKLKETSRRLWVTISLWRALHWRFCKLIYQSLPCTGNLGSPKTQR